MLIKRAEAKNTSAEMYTSYAAEESALTLPSTYHVHEKGSMWNEGLGTAGSFDGQAGQVAHWERDSGCPICGQPFTRSMLQAIELFPR